MYILGVNNGHDRAAVLLRDGVVAAAIEQERLDRRKHSSSRELPWEAIRYCLDAEGIQARHLDLVVGTGLWYYDQLPVLMETFPRVERVSHHLAHAYAAFFSSPFTEAIVVVWDGTGNDIRLVTDRPDDICGHPGDVLTLEAESFYIFQDTHYSVIKKRTAPNPKSISEQVRTAGLGPQAYVQSFGNMYSGAATYIFGDWRESGKVMGLSASGNYDPRRDASLFTGAGLDYEVLGLESLLRMDSPNDRNGSPEAYADIASLVQGELQRGALSVIGALVAKYSTPNIVLSGGVGLNCTLNGLLANAFQDRQLFVPSAPGDGGTALGAAYYGHFQVVGHRTRHYPLSCLWGRSYPDEEIIERLHWFVDRHYLRERLSIRQPDDMPSTVAQLIAGGAVVGWFQGRSEFGPRALGSRSILADPRRPAMKHVLNAKVKHRESFRPFGPSVLTEHADEYFVCPRNARSTDFMSVALPAKPRIANHIPAVVHIDGTSRVQTVGSHANVQFRTLIEAFCRITGVPVVLNTSFNVAGNPIVETPEDAIGVLVATGMDCLSIGGYIVEKR